MNAKNRAIAEQVARGGHLVIVTSDGDKEERASGRLRESLKPFIRKGISVLTIPHATAPGCRLKITLDSLSDEGRRLLLSALDDTPLAFEISS